MLRHASLALALALTACGAAGSYGPAYTAVAGPPPAAAPAAPPSTAAISVDVGAVATPASRPGLGTTWGESVYAPVTARPFTRAGRDPWALAVLRYNDAAGVEAQAAATGGAIAPLEVTAGEGSIGIALVDERGALLPGVSAAGQALVVGQDGARYRIVVRNGTSARFEIVASVDGLDVLDGQPADPARRGYLLEPYGELVIDGFRQSDAQVAAFRFGAVADSYAARSSGDRNVGVVGVAIFAEEGAVWTRGELTQRATANPFPARTYATPP